MINNMISGFLRRERLKATGVLNYYLVKFGLFRFDKKWNKINLCGGGVKITGFCDVDLYPAVDINMDLERKPLPFKANSINAVVCISAINYFSRERGGKIIRDVYRVLKQGGIARFASQDLEEIAKKYVNKDMDFFFQKLPNGKGRFPGKTMADKINSWFYGYKTSGKVCKYFYDYESLSEVFKEAGFKKIERKNYLESIIPEIKQVDNRPEQMFFLEAIK